MARTNGILRPVASAYSTLLEATLEHLVTLQTQGVRVVEVDPATLKALSQPLPREVRSPSKPQSVPVKPTPSRPPPGAVASPTAQASLATPSTVPVPGRAASARLTAGARAEALEQLRTRALACQRCPHLVSSRTQVVFGVGNPEASLMFVGEAPGADEDRLGEPFVGRAGQLLTKIIQAMGLSRESVYIANILKCRPDMPPGSRGNRAPRPEEMDTCKPYLLEQIEIIQPQVLVALGATAVTGLLGLRTSLGAVRGRWHEFAGIPVMPTFHPSYLLRAEDAPDRGHAEKRKTWEDMLLVLERLDLPISDRMRGFFLKPTAGGST